MNARLRMMAHPRPAVLVTLALWAALLAGSTVRAGSLHPDFPLLDIAGVNVLETGLAISPMQTCGQCHDTDYIAGHSYHADAKQWFGHWDPMLYETLADESDPDLGMSRADWIRTYGQWHPGGGPANRSTSGALLHLADREKLSASERRGRDPHTGEVVEWDWAESGAVEMNCFLCHIRTPNDSARRAALNAGDFAWAATATLEGTGVVLKNDENDAPFRYLPDVFLPNGKIDVAHLQIGDPLSENCAACHGTTHRSLDIPFVLDAPALEGPMTRTTGEVFSPQRMDESGVNLVGKESLQRSWDAHAERLLECVDCHYSANNPIYSQRGGDGRPAHLQFDARRLDLGDYLERPSHQFAAGAGEQTDGENAMRSCSSCHDASVGHAWLPYAERHFDALDCNACHAPRLYAPALQVIDWTMMDAEGNPRLERRGLGPSESGDAFAGTPSDQRTDLFLSAASIPPVLPIEGYEPILLPRNGIDGRTRLAPHNLITTWIWVDGSSERPVPRELLRRALWLESSTGGERPHLDILAALDRDHNGLLSADELVLGDESRVAVVRQRLQKVGVMDPRIVAETRAHLVAHAVATGDFALRDCGACHEADSRLARPFVIANSGPNHILPQPEVLAGLGGGTMVRDDLGRLLYEPPSRIAGTYVLGRDSVRAANLVGLVGVVLTALGIGVHILLRIVGSRSGSATRTGGTAAHGEPSAPAYMYSSYERFWHWLQAFAVFLLLATGLEIHAPGSFTLIGFNLAVRVHNVVAFVVVANAALAAFFHIASGEIRQFLPEPKGFFRAAIAQARYYLWGMFHGAPHPFAKTPDHKMNVLQQVTYLVILNLLFPLQIGTGLLIWGAQRWPEVDTVFGGLGLLSPLHAVGAWLFAAFLLLHIYLTTTGPRPTTYLRAMVTGWEDHSAPHPASEESS